MTGDDRRQAAPALPAPHSAAPRRPDAPPVSCDYRVVCPNCGTRLIDRGCKSRCPRCHFFTDCSDPW